MSSFVNICCKLDTNKSNKLNKLVINDFKMNVKTLYELVSKQIDLSEDKFDLICFGRVLSADQPMDTYGISNGTIVFVINKANEILTNASNTSNNMTHKVKTNQSDIQHMVIALRTALMDASFRQMLDKLSDSEARENLMAVTPGLREDPTTFAILQDPDLLTTLTEPTNIHKVLSRHPCLLEAATILSATFHEETIANENTSGPSGSSLLGRSSSTYNYSLDAMSDDDDEESEMSTETTETASSTTTAAALAQMMVRAYQSNQNAGNNSTNSGIITQDMLTQALQQSSQISQPSTSSSSSSTASRLRGWTTQLQQLRDLGINDEIVAIQALEATDGDVQAAINIIFSDNN